MVAEPVEPTTLSVRIVPTKFWVSGCATFVPETEAYENRDLWRDSGYKKVCRL
jgi:hypothetical protein